jgi:hypothetical protein
MRDSNTLGLTVAALLRARSRFQMDTFSWQRCILWLASFTESNMERPRFLEETSGNVRLGYVTVK